MAGAAAGAGLALLGIAGMRLVLRRRRRAPRSSQAESDVTVRAGFAEAESEEASSDDELADDDDRGADVASARSRHNRADWRRIGTASH